jgi:hypothetical protein
MYPRKDLLYHHYLSQDRLKEAEIERSLRSASTNSHSHSHTVICTAFFKAGKQLENWGRQLQQHYDPVLDTESLA